MVSILLRISGPIPTLDSLCDFHYIGRLMDGTEFTNSYQRGDLVTKEVKNMFIYGMLEAALRMKEGSMWELYLPCEIHYGCDRDVGLVKAGSAVSYVFELVKVYDHHRTETMELNKDRLVSGDL